jgi:phage gpG-like protein
VAVLPVAIDFHFAPEPVVVAQALEKAAVRLENLREPLLLSRNLVSDSIKRRFETETDPNGDPWEAWSPSYKRPDGKILNLEGTLEAEAPSIKRMHVTANDLFYEGEDLPSYGMAHQKGVDRTRFAGLTESDKQELSAFGDMVPNRLPARPFIGVDDDAGDAIYLLFDRWVAETIEIGVFSKGPNVGRAFARDPITKRFVGGF